MHQKWLTDLVSTEGRITPECGILLHGLTLMAAAHNKGLTMIELGMFKGRSAIAIGAACETAGGRLTCIDNWCEVPGELAENKAIAVANIDRAGLSHCVSVLACDTGKRGRTWKDGKAAFIFVDADHSTAGVIADYEAWMPHLVENGYIAFHDQKAPGVTAALEQFEKNYPVALVAHTEEVKAYRRVQT